MYKKEKCSIIIITIICCIIMALVETVIEPVYAVKSAAKVIVFLLLPLISMKLLGIKVFDNSFVLNKKFLIKLLLLLLFTV